MTLVQDNSVQAINTALLSIKRDISASTATTAGTTAGLEPGKTYNINISGNAETATTAKTARTATNANHAETAETATKMSNALTVNGKTYNGSEAVDAGVQTVANGGTGVTTQADINKAFISNLDVGESDVTDGTEFVSSWASDNGFSEATALNKPHKRKFSAVWNYIKGKISSVLGLTKDNYGGKANTAWQADEAKTITYTDDDHYSCISAVQCPESYNNSSADWASYIVCNHGNGKTYYHQMLRLPFSSDSIQLQRRVNGELQGWKNVAIMENSNSWSGKQTFTDGIRIPTSQPSDIADGDIWIS